MSYKGVEMGKRKIAIIVPSLETGGAESMVTSLACAINKKKFDVHIVVIGKKKGTFNEKKIESHNIEITYLEKEMGLDIRMFFKMYNTLKELRPNIVHTHLSSVLYVSLWVLMHKTKMIHTVHSRPSKELPSIHRGIMRVLYLINRAVPVAISENIECEMKKVYGLNNTEIDIVYNPVDISRFDVKNIQDKEDKIKFICVARLVAPKNHRFLIQVFNEVKKELNNVELILVGDGELKADIQNQINILGLEESVKVLGNRTDIERLLMDADIFVLTSIYEGVPITILEAMAAGIPVIATDVGGVSNVINNEIGRLVESGNEVKLKSAMIELATQNQLRKQLSEKAKLQVSKYDLVKIAQEYEKLYVKYDIHKRKIK